MVSVNNSTSGAEAHLPFGGNGKSGNGSRQSGIWVLDQFTRWQSMNWDYAGKLQKAQMDLVELPADMDFRLVLMLLRARRCCCSCSTTRRGRAPTWVHGRGRGLGGRAAARCSTPATPAAACARALAAAVPRRRCAAEDRAPKHWREEASPAGVWKPIKAHDRRRRSCERGVLDEERHKTLGAVRVDPATRAPTRCRRRSCARNSAPSWSTTRSLPRSSPPLLGLLVPLDLVKRLVDRSERKQATVARQGDR